MIHRDKLLEVLSTGGEVQPTQVTCFVSLLKGLENGDEGSGEESDFQKRR